MEYDLAKVASSLGADDLAKALQKAGDMYARATENLEKSAVRWSKTKFELPKIGGDISGSGKYLEIFNEDIAKAFTPGGQTKGKKGLSEAQKELNKLLEEGRSLTESLRSPQEAYAAQIDRLNRLVDVGSISQETYNRAVFDYQDQLDAATGKTQQFADLQAVIAEIDPVAPLLDQIEALEELTLLSLSMKP